MGEAECGWWFQELTGRASIGCVVRNHQGEVLLTAWQVLFDCAPAEMAEAIALREGVQLVAEWIRMPTIVESDCAYVLNAVQSELPDRSCCAEIFEEIRGTARILPSVKFVKIGRECNRLILSSFEFYLDFPEFGNV
ncbi:hypothetical protein EJB05_10795, partial [Eragrostis curvula]